VRIALLATDAYGGHGGIALYTRQVAEALARRHEVAVVPRLVRSEPDAVPATVDFRAAAASGNLAYAGSITRLLVERPDLVICGHIHLLPAACVISAHPLLFIYGIEAWKPPPRPLAKRLLSRCRAVVAISALTRDRFLDWSGYSGPTYVIPNAFRPEEFGLRPRRADLEERYALRGRRVLLTIGRLDSHERSKGFDEVLEILGQLPPDVVYLIAGGGDDGERLKGVAARLGVASRVVFTGFFPEEDKADLYALADVYVMPSRGEGFGFVFLEAMASGLPVVASKHDGGKEAVLDGRLGLLVDPSSPDEIRTAVTELLGRSARRIDPRLDHFSSTAFAARVDGMMADLIR
jgi:glycosyltransferase involved in cell wall biosynthesis